MRANVFDSDVLESMWDSSLCDEHKISEQRKSIRVRSNFTSN